MAVVNGKFYTSVCKSCLNQVSSPHAKEYDRERQREKHAADIVQPWVNGEPNRDFIRAYPDRVSEYFTNDDLKKMQ